MLRCCAVLWCSGPLHNRPIAASRLQPEWGMSIHRAYMAQPAGTVFASEAMLLQGITIKHQLGSYIAYRTEFQQEVPHATKAAVLCAYMCVHAPLQSMCESDSNVPHLPACLHPCCAQMMLRSQASCGRSGGRCSPVPAVMAHSSCTPATCAPSTACTGRWHHHQRGWRTSSGVAGRHRS